MCSSDLIEKHYKFSNEKWPEKIYWENMNKVIHDKKISTNETFSINLKEEKDFYKQNNKFKPLSKFLEFDYDGEPIGEI